MNAMSISNVSKFSDCIRDIFQEYRPQRIIETGTYLGEGTTTIIASAIKDFNLDLIKFYSIEINPRHYRLAYINLRDSGLLGFVSQLNGLSIFRSQLPSIEEIEKKFVNKDWPKNIYIDHPKEVRALRYNIETDFPFVPDGLLINCLEKFNYKPDFVLLDSGGHVGIEEFNTVISHVKEPCIIALDDVFHVKHYESLQKIQKDQRFKILHLSEEKFGFCITKFSPEE